MAGVGTRWCVRSLPTQTTPWFDVGASGNVNPCIPEGRCLQWGVEVTFRDTDFNLFFVIFLKNNIIIKYVSQTNRYL